jgi:hypothetical protein
MNYAIIVVIVLVEFHYFITPYFFSHSEPRSSLRFLVDRRLYVCRRLGGDTLNLCTWYRTCNEQTFPISAPSAKQHFATVEGILLL